MAALTDAELLVATREAIDALTANPRKSFTVAGRTVVYADLAELWKQVSRLERRIASASRGGSGRTGVIRFGPRSR